jgi:hypothetical protein
MEIPKTRKELFEILRQQNSGDRFDRHFLAVASGGFQICFQVSQNWWDISGYNPINRVLDTGL